MLIMLDQQNVTNKKSQHGNMFIVKKLCGHCVEQGCDLVINVAPLCAGVYFVEENGGNVQHDVFNQHLAVFILDKVTLRFTQLYIHTYHLHQRTAPAYTIRHMLDRHGEDP